MTVRLSDLDPGIADRIDTQADGCWLYNGQTDRYGVHRLVYESVVGAVPPDHVLHHRCETKGCCNPEHLEVLTYADHRIEHARLRRGRAPAPKTVVAVRLDPLDVEALKAGARRRGKTLSVWVREVLADQAEADRKSGKIK